MLFIITVLLAVLVGGLVYAGRHASTQLNNAQHKIDALNTNLTNINSGINNLSSQLQKGSTSIRIP